jgi:hypothetical protein
MVRDLAIGDFDAAWRMVAPMMDSRLRPDRKRAFATFRYAVTSSQCCAVGDFDEHGMRGIAVVMSDSNPAAGKGFASFQAWVGTLKALDAAIQWWEGRPALRLLSLQFPNNVPPGIYRILRSRGFERSGDMNILWR